MRYRPDKHRLPPFNMDGVLLVDKAPDWTSFDVVNFLKNRFVFLSISFHQVLEVGNYRFYLSQTFFHQKDFLSIFV